MPDLVVVCAVKVRAKTPTKKHNSKDDELWRAEHAPEQTSTVQEQASIDPVASQPLAEPTCEQDERAERL